MMQPFLSHVELIGYVSSEPQNINTDNNAARCRFELTTVENTVDQEGVSDSISDVYNIVCDGSLADQCCHFLDVGFLVYISGRLRGKVMYGTDGSPKYTIEMAVNDVR